MANEDIADHSECSHTSTGTIVYVAEAFNGVDWVKVPHKDILPIFDQTREFRGVPYKKWIGGIHMAAGVLSRHQALAIAHTFAAVQESGGESVEVRIAEYTLDFSFEVKRLPVTTAATDREKQ
jgi:hypothetical protein